jgi:hypothetical protein
MLAVFVDFMSAYDSVWRVKSMNKLQKIGVKCRVHKWFHSFIAEHFCATNLKVKPQNVSKAEAECLRSSHKYHPF